MPLLTDAGLRDGRAPTPRRRSATATGVDPRPWFRCPFGAGTRRPARPGRRSTGSATATSAGTSTATTGSPARDGPARRRRRRRRRRRPRRRGGRPAPHRGRARRRGAARDRSTASRDAGATFVRIDELDDPPGRPSDDRDRGGRPRGRRRELQDRRRARRRRRPAAGRRPRPDDSHQAVGLERRDGPHWPSSSREVRPPAGLAPTRAARPRSACTRSPAPTTPRDVRLLGRGGSRRAGSPARTSCVNDTFAALRAGTRRGLGRRPDLRRGHQRARAVAPDGRTARLDGARRHLGRLGRRPRRRLGRPRRRPSGRRDGRGPATPRGASSRRTSGSARRPR